MSETQCTDVRKKGLIQAYGMATWSCFRVPSDHELVSVNNSFPFTASTAYIQFTWAGIPVCGCFFVVKLQYCYCVKPSVQRIKNSKLPMK